MAATGSTSEAAKEEKICRYCFESEESGELISPCRCTGGQKWVHLACLRRWQRGVLVSQPTHPDLYGDDVRHRICNVCKSSYTCEPPTRLELMQSFTGEELASLVAAGCLIGSARGFCSDVRRQLEGIPEPLLEHVVDRHWLDAVFLIVRVLEDSGPVDLRLRDADGLRTFADQLSEDWCWELQGRSFRLLFEGSLEAAAGLPDRAAKLEAIRTLKVPASVKLSPVADSDVGEDGIIAVNLTRPFDFLPTPGNARRWVRYQRALVQALPAGQRLPPNVVVRHFVGGPCRRDAVGAVLVAAAPQHYEVLNSFPAAFSSLQELQKRWAEEGNAAPAAVSSAAASDAPAVASAAAPDVVAADAAAADVAAAPALAADPAAGGSDGAVEPLAKRPRTGEAGDTTDGDGTCGPGPARTVRLHVFWGSAGWSRCQLIGEIASGSWGLCRSSIGDVVDTAAEALYEAAHPRLIFAPRTEMSESYDREARGIPIDEVSQQRRVEHLQRQVRRREQKEQQFHTNLERLGMLAESPDEHARALLTAPATAMLRFVGAEHDDVPAGADVQQLLAGISTRAFLGISSSEEDSDEEFDFDDADDEDEDEEEEDGEADETEEGSEESHEAGDAPAPGSS